MFWDEEGRKHFHNKSMNMEFYRCSLGHEWNQTFWGSCPITECDWKAWTE